MCVCTIGICFLYEIYGMPQGFVGTSQGLVGAELVSDDGNAQPLEATRHWWRPRK
jgi:hypothetical protein